MKLQVLGCYGGSAQEKLPATFLCNGTVAFDTGALTHVLPVEQQIRITDIFLTHSHFDHLATLPFLLDNIFSVAAKPVVVRGPTETIGCLRDHLFNGVLWPDFTKISNGTTAVVEMLPMSAGDTVQAGGLTITAFAMEHTVPCHGYLIQSARSSVILCGDTCSTECLESIIPLSRNLKAVLLEASFPKDEDKTALLSRHLSTAGFAREAARVPKEVTILVTHRKPEFADTIAAEISALKMKNVTIIEQGETLSF